jgi:hypothetical protein
MQRFREAFDAAREAHAVAPERPDAIAEVIRTAEELLARLETGTPWFEPRAPRVDGVAVMVALPRSGTTLLEQMLDRHPEISGIGEFKGLIAIINGLGHTGYWPQRPNLIPAARLAELQSLYLEGAGRIRRPDARWIFDKVLRAWRAIPEIAAVLPGAAAISVDRDPRDTATSIFLSFFNPGVIPWSGDFASMRRMIELKRRIAPLALELFRMPNVHVAYEDLVEDPAHHAGRCLRLMGLAMDERVTRPEESARRAVTLSSEQVRRPINRSSIGRWRNYAWAFDASWDAVVAEHDAMLAASRAARLASTATSGG